MTAALEDVVAKMAISETLARYCRGIDRCDLDILRSVFWLDAIVNYGSGDVDSVQWCGQVIAALQTMERTQHAISNTLIDLKGSIASVETYSRAYHEVRSPDGMVEMMVGGRYLDEFECRSGQWRITHRRYVMDFNQNGPSTCRWTEGLYAGLKVIGARKPADPSYQPHRS